MVRVYLLDRLLQPLNLHLASFNELEPLLICTTSRQPSKLTLLSFEGLLYLRLSTQCIKVLLQMTKLENSHLANLVPCHISPL